MREYGIELASTKMSYRKFNCLIAGLSPESLCALTVKKEKQDNKLPEIKTPEATAKFWKGVLGGK